MNLLLSSLIIGLIFSLLALGVYISFRIFHFPDITADGSFTFGAAVTVSLLLMDWSPLVATTGGFIAGMGAGFTTGLLHTKFRINGLLSGILVMTALYSINLRVMGRSNVPLSDRETLATQSLALLQGITGNVNEFTVFGWIISVGDVAAFCGALLLVATMGTALYLFLQTDLGTAMRAAGDNPQMIRALGVSDQSLLLLGLAISNGLIAMSGSLLAQYQGFADVQMGIGMVVWGLASVIIGESLVGASRYGVLIAGTFLGSLIFRVMLAIALRWGLNPNDLKLITAVFVFAALVTPGLLKKFKLLSSKSGKLSAESDA